jgi:hypothetical protein
VDEPAEHGRGAIGAVGGEPLRIEAEALLRAFDHSACSAYASGEGRLVRKHFGVQLFAFVIRQ